MGFMVEPLPESRDMDPEHWDQKLTFWTKMVIALPPPTKQTTLTDRVCIHWHPAH